MKFKIVIVAFLLVLCGSVGAQKKVAVVKPYLEGNTSVLHINIVKQTLVSTILKTEGYSAFSRNEIDAIFTEQSFQYGGDVNDATRKKLGDMYGADLLCISQIVGSGGELMMSAMLIDVQTAEILASPDPIVVKAATQNVQEGAKTLAQQLLNPDGATNETTVAANQRSQNANSSSNVQVETSGYVDLGLPSGTKWNAQNEPGDEEGFYKYGEATDAFGDNVPTAEQWKELRGSAEWTWTGGGYTIVGPNGKSIFLPAQGCHSRPGGFLLKGINGFYWSRSSAGLLKLAFQFDAANFIPRALNKRQGLSVRLVQK